jgi:non-lysosomal glucosylceramidase
MKTQITMIWLVATLALPLAAQDQTKAKPAKKFDEEGGQFRGSRTLSLKSGPPYSEDDRRAKTAVKLADPALTAQGRSIVYSGDKLTGIRFPVGGIGSGCIQMDGSGVLRDWQVFNNIRRHPMPLNFFAIKAGSTIRVLQTKQRGPFEPVQSLTFSGEFPFGWWTFRDDALPVSVELEASSPFIPFDTEASGTPCGLFRFTLKNTGKQPVEVSLLGSLQNACGWDGKEPIQGNAYPTLGGNANRMLALDGGAAMILERPAKEPGAGLALVALQPDAKGLPGFGSHKDLHAAFAQGGITATNGTSNPTRDGTTSSAALMQTVKLAAGESKTLTFAIAWYFPGYTGVWGSDNKEFKTRFPDWKWKGLEYENHWKSIDDLAAGVAKHAEAWRGRALAYHDALYQSNFPRWLLDRISSQAAILISRTTAWDINGNIGLSEGTNHGLIDPKVWDARPFNNCTHVFHYAQTHARLFPELARRLREQDYLYQHPESGGIAFRHAPGKADDFAFDGQCGVILATLRETQTGTDHVWLKARWPGVKKAMDYLVATHDPDSDGWLTGIQHNTLDCQLSGTPSWHGSLYLAALAATVDMAGRTGDADAAKRYGAILASGRKLHNERLFDGEHFITVPDPIEDLLVAERRAALEAKGNKAKTRGGFDILRHIDSGNHIDQCLGDWWAAQVGIGPIYDPAKVATAMKNLFRDNFIPDATGFTHAYRKYWEDGDAGLLITTWDKDKLPSTPMKYHDEVMSGFEYAAAATMIQSGNLKEGLAVAKAVRDRYDGRARTTVDASAGYESGSPFGDDECGKYYGRAMASWSLLTSLQGFRFDAPGGLIGFAPVWQPEDHRSFFTTTDGYGLFSQQRQAGRQENKITLVAGTLSIHTIELALAGSGTVTPKVVCEGKTLSASCSQTGSKLALQFKTPLRLSAGQTLKISLLPLATKAAETKQPNIVVILADDLGYGDLACFGAKNLRTPQLDRMAAEGLKLTSFYAGASVCSPSRAALLTGLYPPEAGVTKVLLPGEPGLPADRVTMAEMLKEAGYATACFGKWHLGDAPEFLPQRHGFGHFFGLPYSHDMIPGNSESKITFPPLPLMRDGKVLETNPEIDAYTRRFTDAAVEFVRQNRERPFFIYLAHPMPHRPYGAGDQTRVTSDDKESRDDLFEACIADIDASVGSVLAALKETGIDGNTLVIFTSDNGAPGGGRGSNAPLRGSKGDAWDGGFRVPCIVRWPGTIPPGRESAAPLSMLDLMPTVAVLAGSKAPDGLPGRDVGGFLKGGPPPVPAPFLFYVGKKICAVREGDWKLHTAKATGKKKDAEPGSLYNMAADMAEAQDLSKQFPEIRQQLERE